jgi:hypothetical protein
MIEGKTAENGKWSITQKCRNQKTVLIKNVENRFSQRKHNFCAFLQVSLI